MRLKFRYGRLLKETAKKLTDRRMLPLWICLAGMLAVFILITSLGSSSDDITAADTALYGRSKLTVGMVTGIESMAEVSEDGEITGFNREFMDTVLGELYPEKDIIYQEISSQQASYALKSGQVDFAVGAFTSGVTKTLGLSLSNEYCTDEVYAYVVPSSGITSLSGLIGRRVYATTTEFTEKSLNSALSAKNLEIDYIPAASYPDVLYAMDSARADAVITMSKLAGEIAEKYEPLPEPVMTVSCRILAWTDNADAISLINARIAAYREDGTLEAMMLSHGIAPPFQEEK